MPKSDTSREISAVTARPVGARRLGIDETNDDDGADGLRSIRRVPTATAQPIASLPTARAADPGTSRSAHVPKPIATPDAGTRTRTRRPV